MEKRILLIVLAFSYLNFLYSQNHDYYWPFGYDSYSTFDELGGSVIDFNAEPPLIFKENKSMNLDRTCASICDTLGNLLFYTNGEYIANYLHEKIPGSDTLNPGPLFNNVTPYGYRIIQGALILPSPKENEDNIFYLFHEIGEYGNADLSSHVSGLYRTVVDMSMNNGTGGIVSKRDIVIEDTLVVGKFQAVKHANGRDWWMLVTEHSTNRFYKILLDTLGIHITNNQTIGIPSHPWEGIGQVAFSPDGAHYARFNCITLTQSDLDLYDFNRCTGELSNPIHFTINDTCSGGGIAFSPNSRFMYVITTLKIFQYDLWADNILESKETVAVFDDFWDPLPTRFFLAQLGPDGKIYINSRSNVRYLHYIANPNEKGVACNVVQHGIQLPTYNAWTMPNFPNYRLGAIPPITPSFTHSISSDTVFFQNTSTGGKEYEWDFGDGTTGAGHEISHVFGQSGSYVVTLTVSENCISEIITDTVSVIISSVKQQEKGAVFQVYPNPATNQINLSFTPSKSQAVLTLTDIYGRQITNIQVAAGASNLSVSTANMNSGVYFLMLRFNDNNVLSKTILISK